MINRHPLSLQTLGIANQARLPQFNNRHGIPAHLTANGSDWSVADWLEALVGEVGEFAEVRQAFEAGKLTAEEYEKMAARELADILTYLSILASRALDVTNVEPVKDRAQVLMGLVACLGSYANQSKKLRRGDMAMAHFDTERYGWLSAVQRAAGDLINHPTHLHSATEHAHPLGVDLSTATVEKFNEVSARVRCNVWISPDKDCVSFLPAKDREDGGQR